MQSRALLTYIRRIYYPFLLHEPAIPKDCPILAAYWAHTQPLLAGMPQAQNSVSVALVIPALAALPLALQEISKHLSAPLLPFSHPSQPCASPALACIYTSVSRRTAFEMSEAQVHRMAASVKTQT